jgi:hypothetical protein
MKYKPTHRIVVKATSSDTEAHSYECIDIDIHSGLFKKCLVKQNDTPIRIRDLLFGEILLTNKPMSLQESLSVADSFNEKRAKLGYSKVEFNKLTEEENRGVSGQNQSKASSL